MSHFADEYQPSFGVDWVPYFTQAQVDAMDEEQLRVAWETRVEVEENGKLDPVEWGWVLPGWRQSMAAWKSHHIHVILGGNRSSKSSYAARLCVWAARTIPEAEIRCWHVNQDRSVEDQQRFIWEALPEALKASGKRKGPNWSIQYTQKNGFAGNVCILPPLPGCVRGGTIKFNNYRQFQQDEQVAEGFKAHLVWADEEMPHKLFETMLPRLWDHHGRLVMTFTTLQGWTPLIQDVLGRAEAVEKRFADLLNTKLPVIQDSRSRPGARIFYFWTEDNPFINAGYFKEGLNGRPKEEILARAYGVPSKSATSRFPKFSREVNVVKKADLPWVKQADIPVIRWMALDPAGSKAWFMVWVAIDATGAWYVYREHPTDTWAEASSDVKGKRGPGQRGSGMGIDDYVGLITDLEGEEQIWERVIDPRMGAAEVKTREGATSIISELDSAGMVFQPAPGVDIEHGLQLLNDLMTYDDQKPVSAMNRPKFFVSEECENTIFALLEYTGAGGKDEAVKDPVDVLRYLAVAGAEFIDPKMPVVTGGMGGY